MSVEDGRRSPTNLAGGRLPSLPEVFRSVAIPEGASFWRKVGAFSGPGFLVAVGYVDPGNWAADIAGGSRYGLALLSVIVLSNLVAVFLQTLALRLGIASGRDLAQLCRDRFGRRTALLLWVGCQAAIIACDLAEIIGAAIALWLLFGLPLVLGASLTGFDVLLALWLQRRGFRYLEALVISLLCVIGCCLGIELFLARPEISAIARSLLPPPQIVTDPRMLLVAVAIFGATVMPHNLYLHSAIAQTRDFDKSERGRREAIRFATIETVTALTAALFINTAILIVAASFNRSGYGDIGDLREAYRVLSPVLGTGLASFVFAVGLFASGQNSAVTGTLAGQVVAEGFFDLRLPPVLRRLLTRAIAIVPVLVVTALGGEAATGRLLILSQVVLSLQLPFAVVPLLMFTSDRRLMGRFANPAWARLTGSLFAAVIIGANGLLLWQTLS